MMPQISLPVFARSSLRPSRFSTGICAPDTLCSARRYVYLRVHFFRSTCARRVHLTLKSVAQRRTGQSLVVRSAGYRASRVESKRGRARGCNWSRVRVQLDAGAGTPGGGVCGHDDGAPTSTIPHAHVRPRPRARVRSRLRATHPPRRSTAPMTQAVLAVRARTLLTRVASQTSWTCSRGWGFIALVSSCADGCVVPDPAPARNGLHAGGVRALGGASRVGLHRIAPVVPCIALRRPRPRAGSERAPRGRWRRREEVWLGGTARRKGGTTISSASK
ncbi:hypothetical protein MSAN_02111700 [Mycena sanguinolenta]|uniref:Uncharacterized protein n=1 Tax=Mycena sanguinolenta TaxID=230812 RepID=A0A8H7CKA0_9AGAR|nr:hypothetical protein MSAN_02111700 [Mycena sanguinolenta]